MSGYRPTEKKSGAAVTLTDNELVWRYTDAQRQRKEDKCDGILDYHFYVTSEQFDFRRKQIMHPVQMPG